MERRNPTLMVGLVLVVVLAVIAFPFVRLLLVKMKVQDVMLKMGRFPSAAQVVDLPGPLKQAAVDYKVDPAAVKVRLSLEERQAGPTTFFYVVAELDYGRKVVDERRIETGISPEFLAALQEGGVEVRLLKVPEAGASEEGAGEGE